VNGKEKCGLDMKAGDIGDMEKEGVTECFRVKEQALLAASEAAEMILRVDDIVRCAPR
jgi:T-complex protein 1 subunit beta